MADDVKRVSISLQKKDKNFIWEKDWKYYFLFPTSDIKYAETQIAYWMLVFDDKDARTRKINWDRDVKAISVVWIKEHVWDDWHSWLSWMMFDNENKKAWYVNLNESTFNQPGEEPGKYLSIKDAEYRERGTWDRDNLPF